MRCGISTSCFYPETPLEALHKLIGAGAPVAEVFINTFAELEEGYVNKLVAAQRASGIQVVSVHPFSAVMEGFLFASDYKTRFDDGVKLYRQFFHLCARLGATMLVFHGDHAHALNSFTMERYVHRFRKLAAVGREYGVTLCHENVYYCRLGEPDAVRRFRALMGEDAAFVLDLKQVRRAGAHLADMLDAMAGAVRHVHISDFAPGRDCLPPGEGQLDFIRLVRHLEATGYTGDYIVELYRDNFADDTELYESMQYVETLIGRAAPAAPEVRLAAEGWQ
ncbi:MAG: sugar phosphate isomerase/epimerase [Ruminococcaceae bacterium]|nr:sugar phosphate isomerase/epimerase [Oscillospiraceae bacterium]